MGRATDRFIAEIKKSHRVCSYVDVTSPSGHTVRLRLLDGAVNVDRTAQYRRAATMVAFDPTGTMTPSDAGGILTPLGTELRPYRGVIYSDGTVEVYPQGVFRLSYSAVTESVGNAGGSTGTGGSGQSAPSAGSVPSGAIQIKMQMFDRSRSVSRNKFTSVFTIPAGKNLIDAIKLILGRTFPNLQYDAISTTLTAKAPMVFNVSDDPWTAATSIATSLGCDLYFDVDGDVVIAPPTDIDSLAAPHFEYVEGQGNTLTQLEAVYADDAPGYNGVVVTGQSVGNETPPVMAVAWDAEPSSPTYYLGPYGQVPTFVNDTNITTTVAAQTAANSLLGGILGFSAQLTATAWVNPAMEVGDVLRFVRTPLNVSGLYTPDAFTVPLMASETQTITVRSKRTVA
jgi:hypothetical protein